PGSMVLVAVAAAAAWAPWALAGAPREVARSGVDPVVEIARTLSPLAQYRASFTDDTAYDEALFTVAAPAEVERIRLATLPFFDGRTARAVDPTTGDEDPATAFIRVPSAIDQGAGAIADVAVTIGALEGIWLPTAGSLAEITFEGPRAADLADGFFHNTATGAAVQLAEPGLSDGDAYRLRVAAPETGADVASLTPLRNGPSLDDAIVPESLREWIDAQAAPAGGAGLAELIDRLRARGYLSHALAVDTANPPTWLSDLGAPDFQPSRAGHSTDRIGDLFDQLLDRQVELGDAPDPQLVAGVGDDEQFAVAAAMIADQLGFDTRIVVGTRLASAEDLPVCDDDGTCRGGDLAAWIEVRGAEGRWVAIDVTPQHEVFPSPDLEQRQDPKNPTDVRDDDAEEVLPPEANPAEGTARDEDVAEETTDLSALWSALRVAGISLSVLVVLIGPLLVIVLVKAVRRRSRRRSPDVVTRFTGGWEEFVDTAVDHGYPVPAAHTRQELAALYAGGDPSSPRRMATWADRSVFDVAPPTEAENAEFWRLVDAERARLAGEGTFWSRLRARVSLRSLRARPQRPARR
ncbi:transglutaminase-like domain-containing protein, partial [Microbacterium sp.]|uniref:transglutaminase-like domain-containing protein n=1 Tax=Microbacterium sp. TaxID=51671 RepID=UPI0037369EC1